MKNVISDSDFFLTLLTLICFAISFILLATSFNYLTSSNYLVEEQLKLSCDTKLINDQQYSLYESKYLIPRIQEYNTSLQTLQQFNKTWIGDSVVFDTVEKLKPIKIQQTTKETKCLMK